LIDTVVRKLTRALTAMLELRTRFSGFIVVDRHFDVDVDLASFCNDVDATTLTAKTVAVEAKARMRIRVINIFVFVSNGGTFQTTKL